MKTVGTVELDSENLLDVSSTDRRSFGGSGNDPDDGGRDDQDNIGSNSESKDHVFSPDKYRILMLFLLLVVFMTFGGLVAAYVALQTNKAQEWQPFPLPFQVWVSTALIIAGSVSFTVFEKNSLAGKVLSAWKWLLATTAIGAVFISSQLIVWLQLVQEGLYMRGNPYVGFFYILTVVHAVHVLGGLVSLGALLYRVKRNLQSETEVEQRNAFAHVVGWYWHFMGGLWIVLVFFLGFWK